MHGQDARATRNEFFNNPPVPIFVFLSARRGQDTISIETFDL